MGNYTGGGRTVCPFYLKEAERSITCESLIDHARTMVRFENAREKREHQQAYCEGEYTVCPYAASIAQKYENDANSVPNDANSVPIGGRVLFARRRRGWSQKTLARRAHVSRSYLCDIEHNRRNPSLQTLVLLSSALGMELNYFVAGANKNKGGYGNGKNA